MNQIAARLKEFEVTLENQRLDRLVQRASVLYSEKQKSFEEPITVSLACAHNIMCCCLRDCQYLDTFFPPNHTSAYAEKSWANVHSWYDHEA